MRPNGIVPVHISNRVAEELVLLQVHEPSDSVGSSPYMQTKSVDGPRKAVHLLMKNVSVHWFEYQLSVPNAWTTAIAFSSVPNSANANPRCSPVVWIAVLALIQPNDCSHLVVHYSNMNWMKGRERCCQLQSVRKKAMNDTLSYDLVGNVGWETANNKCQTWWKISTSLRPFWVVISVISIKTSSHIDGNTV